MYILYTGWLFENEQEPILGTPSHLRKKRLYPWILDFREKGFFWHFPKSQTTIGDGNYHQNFKWNGYLEYNPRVLLPST